MIKKIMTVYGEQKAAKCLTEQIDFGIKYIAVGDGNGSTPIPDKNNTSLVHEVWRGEISELIKEPPKFTAIGYIPEDVGGFVIREVGLFDENGNLLFISQVDPTPKNDIYTGIPKQLGFKCIFELADGLNPVIIDPTILIASTNYVNGIIADLTDKVDETISNIEDSIVETQNAILSQANSTNTQINSINNQINLKIYKIGAPIICLDHVLNDGEIWLEGGEVSRTTYASLFAVYGTTYGAGNGSTTFNLPDFRDRALWGSNWFGYTGAGLPNITGHFTAASYVAWGGGSFGDSVTGAFYNGYQQGTHNVGNGGSVCSWKAIGFNASMSNGIYGASGTVQPNAIRVRVKTRYR